MVKGNFRWLFLLLWFTSFTHQMINAGLFWGQNIKQPFFCKAVYHCTPVARWPTLDFWISVAAFQASLHFSHYQSLTGFSFVVCRSASPSALCNYWPFDTVQGFRLEYEWANKHPEDRMKETPRVSSVSQTQR